MRKKTSRTARRPLLKTWLFSTALSLGLGGIAFLHAQDAQTPPTKTDQQLPTLPPTKVEGKTTTPTAPVATPPEAPFQAPPMTPSIAGGGPFSSPPTEGYRADTATTGTKVDVPLIDYPGTVSVVPRDLIHDQAAFRVEDILRDIPGAVSFGNFRRDSFTVRGFELQQRDYRLNGFTDPSPVPRDLANIERIELLQGPSSVLYGSGQPSGVFNFITKKPLPYSYNHVGYEFGSFGLSRTTLDLTGPVDDKGTLLYRFNAAYTNQNSFRDFGFDEHTFIAPAFTFLLDDDTALTVEGSYLNDRRHLDSGVAAINGRLILPISESLNEPTDFQRYLDYKASANLTHRFDDGLTGRVGFFSNWYDNSERGTVPIQGGTLIGLPPTTLLRQTQSFVDREQFYSLQADLNGKFDTGSFHHNTLVGTELSWFRASDFAGKLSDPVGLGFIPPFTFFPAPVQPIDVLNPKYGGPTPSQPGTFTATSIQERYGFYAQDFVDLSEHWKLLAGLRYDAVHSVFGGSFDSPFGAALGQPDFAFPETDATHMYYHLSPRVGLVYEPIPEMLSFYGSYSQSFDPPGSGILPNPQILRPEVGHSAEAGMKLDLFDKWLSLTAAGFYIQKDNFLTQDTFLFATQVGSIRSQGAELSAVGKLSENWSILANYAYTDSRITNDADPARIGNRFRNVPFNNANLWSRYNLIQTCEETFGVGMGIVYVGDRYGDLADSFSLPGYTRWDAGMFYRYKRLDAALYVENVFDRKYYAGSIDSLSVFPGSPITARAQIGFTF